VSLSASALLWVPKTSVTWADSISLLRLSRREERWKDAEILMLRHRSLSPCASSPGL
jgi:hypothetical protein